MWLQPRPLELVTLGQITRGQDWRLSLAHAEPHALLVWITRGQGLALLDGTRRGLGVHNALYLPAGSLFSIDLGRQGFGQALALPPDSAERFPEHPYHLRSRENVEQNELNGLLDAFAREQAGARAHAADAMRSYADLIALWLRRALSAQGGGAADTPSDRLMRAYCTRLALPRPAATTMADHAAALGVTPTHLSRVCKARTGRTAAQLAAEAALHGARSLLQDSAHPVQDIARHLGFASPAYFTRFINRHTGQAPTALRRGATR
jgi:AraC family transcriptional activator of pobA